MEAKNVTSKFLKCWLKRKRAGKNEKPANDLLHDERGQKDLSGRVKYM